VAQDQQVIILSLVQLQVQAVAVALITTLHQQAADQAAVLLVITQTQEQVQLIKVMQADLVVAQPEDLVVVDLAQ
jgi:hypothetical protein